MKNEVVNQIKANPKYQELVRKRNVLAVMLSIFVLTIFYGFILTVAFEPTLLGTKIGDGVMTIAFPVAAGIIILSFITTLIYVRKANGEFEKLLEEIRKETRF